MTSSLSDTIAAAAAHAAREAEEKAELDAAWERIKLDAIKESLPQAAERLHDITGRDDLVLTTTPEEAAISWDGYSTSNFDLRYAAPDGLVYIASGRTVVAGERVYFTLSVEHTTTWGAVDTREFHSAASHLEALNAISHLQTSFQQPKMRKRRRLFRRS